MCHSFSFKKGLTFVDKSSVLVYSNINFVDQLRRGKSTKTQKMTISKLRMKIMIVMKLVQMNLTMMIEKVKLKTKIALSS